MTTYHKNTIVCGACRHAFLIQELASTNSMGSPDLDTRPPEMQRSTMNAWVHRCPSCGHCSGNVARFDEGGRSTLESSEYRNQLNNSHRPALANSFVCAGMLAEAIGASSTAAWNYLHAAWALDDEEDDNQAQIWRAKAADIIISLRASGKRFSQQDGATEAILTDCLRRSGRCDEALELIAQLRTATFPDIIHDVLRFQETLLQNGDTQCHQINEAIDDK